MEATCSYWYKCENPPPMCVYLSPPGEFPTHLIDIHSVELFSEHAFVIKQSVIVKLTLRRPSELEIMNIASRSMSPCSFIPIP